MRKILLTVLCAVSISTFAQQNSPRVITCFENMKNSTGGDNWNIKSLDELAARTKAPFLTITKDGYDPDFNGYKHITAIDLSNNNMVGDLSQNSLYLTEYVNEQGQTVSLSNPTLIAAQHTFLRLSNNKLTSVPQKLIDAKERFNVDELWVDNNSLSKLEYDRQLSGTLKSGLFKLCFHQNEITEVTAQTLGIKKYPLGDPYSTSLNSAIDNKAELLRCDNNRLTFSSLIPFLNRFRYDISDLGPYNTGNPNCVIDYAPQKPVGGEATEQIVEDGTVVDLSFSLTHPANVYQWTLNGYEVTGTNTNDYSVSVSKATAGVWRCKVTNPHLPELALYSYDMAVFLKKEGNQIAKDISFSHGAIVENHPEGAILGQFSATDPDGDKLFFRLPDKTADNSHFRISGNSLMSAETLFDRDYIENYKIEVEAYDIYGGKFVKKITVEKGDANGVVLPSNITLSANTIEENKVAQIGVCAIVGGDAGFVLTLPEEADNAHFTLKEGKLSNKAAFNYENKSSYKLRLRAEKEGVHLVKEFNIQVKDVNDAPTDIQLTSNRLIVNNKLGDIVGYLIGIDDDHTEFTYKFSENVDNKYFSLTNNILKAANVFEENATYNIGITVTDGDGASFSKVFTINIIEGATQNLPPISAGLSNTHIPFGSETGFIIGQLNLSDPEGATGTFTCQNSFFEIEGADLKLLNAPEPGSVNELEVTCSDGENTIMQKFNIYAGLPLPQNDAPTAIGLTNNVVLTSTTTGENIAEIVMSDPDGDEGVYTIDSEHFEIDGSSLILKSRPKETTVSIEITANDGELEFSENFKIYFAVNSESTDVVEDISAEEKLLIYPNPTKDKLYVSKPGQIRIYDTIGKLLINRSVNDQINISNLETGMYVIILESESVYYEYKIIKE